jgi:hypothetical protein
MTAKVRELFTGALNTSLQGKTADIGSTWRVASSTGSLNTKLGGDDTAYNTDSLDRAVNNTATAANDRVKGRFTFDSSLTGTRQVGLAVRLQAVNGAAGLYFVASPTGLDFFRLDAGGSGYFQILGVPMTIAIGTPFTMEVIPSGNGFTLKFNESVVGTPTDATYPNGGFSGMHIRAAKAYWFEAGDAGDPDPEGGGNTAPSVTTHPQSQSVNVGSNVSFTSAATGTPTPTLQWQRFVSGAWADISGQTSSPLSLTNVQLSDNGAQFRAKWTNSVSTVYSNTATLTVTQPAGVDLTTSPDFKVTNVSGSPLASRSFDLSFYNASTDALVVKLTRSTDASALFGMVRDSTLTAGVTYDIKFKDNVTGQKGLITATAVA